MITVNYIDYEGYGSLGHFVTFLDNILCKSAGDIRIDFLCLI